MYSYEMIGCAEDNGRTYESEFGTFNKDTGFILSPYADSLKKEELVYQLFHKNCWVLQKQMPKRKKMTLKEIEEELGYPVEIKSENEKKEDEYINEAEELLNFLFGGRR